MRLTQMQERNYEIQSEIAQRKTDGRHSIHYTTDMMIRRLSITDGDEPAQQLSTLAKEMLSLSKRHTAGHLLQLSLNANGISRCNLLQATYLKCVTIFSSGFKVMLSSKSHPHIYPI